MALQTGDVIDGKYRIVRAIGEGGMGAVYEAEHARIHRRVAIKTLHPVVAADGDAVERFEREAQAAGRIGNEHILEVFDMGSLPDGARYMVMEYLDGETLSQRIRRHGRLSAQAIVPLARQILIALDAAHASGIVHRDLKPDNVFVMHSKTGHRDFVKLIDFGISKFQAFSGEALAMTKTGAVIGTPYYMSPEQAAGTTALDKRADLYAAGVILYEAVTGTVPFRADTFNQLIIKIALSDPPPVRTYAPDLDDAFASIIAKSMMRDPAQRFQTAEEFIEALDGWSKAGAAVSVPVPTTRMDSGQMAAFGGAATMVASHGSDQRPSLTARPDAPSYPLPISAQNWNASQPGHAHPPSPSYQPSQSDPSHQGNWVASHHGNWAASQTGVVAFEQPKPKRGFAFVAGALVGAGLLAAGALIFFIHKSRSASDAAAAAAQPPPVLPTEAPTAPASVVVAPMVEAPPIVATDAGVVAPAGAAKPGAPVAAAPSKPGSPSKPGEPSPPAAPLTAATPLPTPAETPPPAPAPAPAPAPPPAPAPGDYR